MNAPEKTSAFVTLADKAKAMCDDPAAFFNHSYTEMHSISREAVAELQLEALKQRFAQLRDNIPMLKMLADKQGIEKLETTDDVLPLLFEHTMYKSYPPVLLETGRFAEINKFLSRLSTFDLTGIDVSDCETIDDWIIRMDEESPLVIQHSSGTSGVMSFLPCSSREWDKHGECIRVSSLQTFGEDPKQVYKDEFNVIYPSFRSGGSGHARTAKLFAKHIAGTEDRLFTAYQGRMSSDVMYLAAKVRAAQAKGELHRLKISPALLAKKGEYEKLAADMPVYLANFFNDLADKLKGKRVFFWGAQNLLYTVAQTGQAKGLRNNFASNSVMGCGGDSKDGVVMPPNWQQQVCEYAGVDRVRMCYGMTEVKGHHHKCQYGHYHLAPWVIPFVLDPDTSKLLPRKGRTTGRGAFYDLAAETRWGGFITGDQITVDWDTKCPCGQESIFIEDGVTRISAARGGDDKINCAATEGAHKEAMSFLTNFQ